MKKPTIVLCNDDGIEALGIYHLWQALTPLANLVIVAPAEDQSCKGMSISLPENQHIEAEKVPWEKGTEAWKVFGTPVDCIKFALDYLLKEKPSFIASGINDGNNAGRNVMHSGTVAATIQATFCNVSGIAFSCVYEDQKEKFQKSVPYVRELMSHFIDHPLPHGTLMNVNFPSLDTLAPKGYKMARQGLSYWNVRIGSDSSLKGTNKYPLIDTWDYYEEKEDSDIHLLQNGYITCVPIHVKDLTDHTHHENHKPFLEKLNERFGLHLDTLPNTNHKK